MACFWMLIKNPNSQIGLSFLLPFQNYRIFYKLDGFIEFPKQKYKFSGFGHGPTLAQFKCWRWYQNWELLAAIEERVGQFASWVLNSEFQCWWRFLDTQQRNFVFSSTKNILINKGFFYRPCQENVPKKSSFKLKKNSTIQILGHMEDRNALLENALKFHANYSSVCCSLGFKWKICLVSKASKWLDC